MAQPGEVSGHGPISFFPVSKAKREKKMKAEIMLLVLAIIFQVGILLRQDDLASRITAIQQERDEKLSAQALKPNAVLAELLTANDLASRTATMQQERDDLLAQVLRLDAALARLLAAADQQAELVKHATLESSSSPTVQVLRLDAALTRLLVLSIWPGS